jgi:serine/threonine-protein kinase RsbW
VFLLVAVFVDTNELSFEIWYAERSSLLGYRPRCGGRVEPDLWFAGCGVTLAVDEALANIIRHSYKNRDDQRIEFNCDVNAEQMEFTLLDRGEPPDPARICGQPLDEFSLSGRGTHLIKAIMDEVSYKRVSGGNQLKLIKRLPIAKKRDDGD